MMQRKHTTHSHKQALKLLNLKNIRFHDKPLAALQSSGLGHQKTLPPHHS
jgi:hypothetical protein